MHRLPRACANGTMFSENRVTWHEWEFSHCIFYIKLLFISFQSVVQNVLQRIEDVQSMCDKRRQSLKRLVQKLNRPVQAVLPEPAAPLTQQQVVPPSSPAPHSPNTVVNEEVRRRKKSLTGGGKRNGSVDRTSKVGVFFERLLKEFVGNKQRFNINVFT